MLSFLLNLAMAEPTTEPFTFTSSIVSIAEPVPAETAVQDQRYQPMDPSALTSQDAFSLGYDAARHNLEQRSKVSKSTLVYSLIEGTAHGYLVGATAGFALFVTPIPHVILNNIVVFLPVKVEYDGSFDPEQQTEALRKHYRRGYRRYYRLRKRAIMIPTETVTFIGGATIGSVELQRSGQEF